MYNFSNKVGIITGGATGIGKQVALDLSQMGAKVVIAGRNAETGSQTVNEITDKGGRAIFVKTDVTSEKDVKNLIDTTLQSFDNLDFAFNNAGIEQKPMALADQTEDLYYNVMDTNVKGVWLCMKYQIPAMLKNGGGTIVNASSFSGSIAFANIPLYVASKHAVVGLTKSVALEYAKSGIRINAILPGAVEDTGTFERSFGNDEANIEWAKSIHPMGRLATPKEISEAVTFMLSNKAAFMTGHSLIIDGGYTAA